MVDRSSANSGDVNSSNADNSGIDWPLVEGLVKSLGSEDFSPAFYRFWNNNLDIDQCTVWKISKDKPPVTLVAERPGEGDRIRKLCQIYTDNMYAFDPQIQSLEQSVTVNRVVLDKIPSHEYRRILFEEADLQEKIFILCRQGEGAYYINLYRRHGQPLFSDEVIEHCRQLAPVAAAFLDKHLALLPTEAPTQVDHTRMLEELETFFGNHPAKLSQREASTCAYIITGHSNEAISLHLGVSLNTVRTFRRRAYAKLNLATQSELFALYLENSPV